jgi:SAM-dependent methyltransferase
MRQKFVDFLRTIFYQLNDQQVLQMMNDILNDPNKSDAEIYETLLNRIGEAKKRFPMLHKIWSLFVLKRGMGRQAAKLLAPFNPQRFHDYMEIYDRRSVKSIRQTTKMPFDGQVVAVCNDATVGVIDRLQAGALTSRYPYNVHVGLNDENCTDPFAHPEQTHKPIGGEVADASIDLIACLGGLHHIPQERVDAFIESMHKKLRPGGVVLLREHDARDEQVFSIASVVHSFVNAADGVLPKVERREVREFKSLDAWTQLMEWHGFVRVSPDALVLRDDPTQNAMFAFVKQPETLDELRAAMLYRRGSVRPREGTKATWIEWGNVRYAQQYAEHIQTRTAASFDYIGHLRQHWQHFYYFVKELLNDPEQSKRALLFSDAMLMNLFILLGTSVQCIAGAVTSVPSKLLRRSVAVVDPSGVQRYVARYEKDYADNLDTIPFYAHNYLKKVRGIWHEFLTFKESIWKKIGSIPTLLSYTFSFLAMTAICAPIKMFYTQESNREPEKVTVIVYDPADAIKESNGVTEVLRTQACGYKLLSVDRYRPFTEVMKTLQGLESVQVLEIGGQQQVSVDVKVNARHEAPNVGRLVYEMADLSSSQGSVFRTYMVATSELLKFQKQFEPDEIYYVHE